METRVTIPTLHVVADNIPQAHYRALKAVYENGLKMRTQYDKVNPDGSYMDPPTIRAKVLIEVANPFNQPRYSGMSYSERGKYIAEIMGVKDHLVLPYETLVEQLKKGKLQATEWPYSYHQRLFTYPIEGGKTIDQMDLALERLKDSSINRRAVASTSVPAVDALLKDDMPCLREIHLECTEHEGISYLHMDAKWRSRDLPKAWGDNVVGLTFMQQVLAKDLEKRIGREVRVGSYSDYSSNLHIYGQDITGAGKGALAFIELGEEKAVARAKDSQFAAENIVIPELENLMTEETWRFGEKQLNQIKGMIADIESGRLLA
ncbi:MAG: thymidylate synthase [archaeon]